jgi:hypothetical protein
MDLATVRLDFKLYIVCTEAHSGFVCWLLIFTAITAI